MIWAFPFSAKDTFRSRSACLLPKRVGLSVISFALQKEGGQKDATSIPNASEIGG